MADEINEKPSGKPGNRQKRREEQRRIKLGTKFMEENDKRINERTYQYLAEAFLEKQRIRESGDQTAVPVPVTTRGIGLNITASFNYLETRHNKAVRYSNMNRHSLYRFSLMQMEKQLFEAENQRPGREFDPLISREYERSVFQEYFMHLSVKDNLGLVANAINSLGTFEHNQTVFRTKVSAMKTVGLDIPMETPHMSKRPAPSGTRIVPDPYLVRITNLRDVVVALSDPATPEEQRIRFRRLDPIPGSEWVENLLTNPDDIMPAGYNVRYFQRDQAEVCDFLANIKRYDKCYLAPVSLDGSGLRTVLTTLHQSPRSTTNWADFSTAAYEGLTEFDPSAVRCLYPLSSTDTLYAMLALMSEWPVDWGQASNNVTFEWAMRCASLSSFGYLENWSTLVGNILNTIPKPLSTSGPV